MNVNAKNIFITTTDIVEGGKIKRYLGVVSSTEHYVHPMSTGLSWIRRQAKDLGANGVIGLSIIPAPDERDYYLVSGTAVEIEFKSGAWENINTIDAEDVQVEEAKQTLLECLKKGNVKNIPWKTIVSYPDEFIEALAVIFVKMSHL